MHLHLVQMLPARVKLPKFPSRHFLSNALTLGQYPRHTTAAQLCATSAHARLVLCSGFVEKRRAHLNRYIEQLAAVADVWRVPGFVRMLDGPREILASQLATLWEHNAEKVRGHTFH